MKKKLLSLLSTAVIAMASTVGASAQLWILGEVDGNGDTWAPNIGTQMTASENPGVYTATVVLSGKNSGYNYFSFTEKLAESASDWSGIASSRWGADANDYPVDSHLGEAMILKKGENAFKLSAGTYDLLVNLNEGTLTVTNNGVEPVPVDYPTSLYVLGEVNDNSWAPNVGVEMTAGEAGKFTATITSDGRNDGYNYFSFTSKLAESADDWDAIAGSRYGADTNNKEVVLGEAMTLQAGENTFIIGAGEFSLSVDLAAGTLTVTGDTPTPPEPVVYPTSLYVLGEANGNSWAPNVGVEMTAGEAGKFTATITSDGRNDGYNYFSFTSKLAESADDWAAIAGSRYGADANDKEVVLGEAMTLQAGENAFKIGSGEFALSVDLAAGTLTVTGDTPTPPEPGEDNVYVLGTVNGGHGWSPDLGTALTKESEGLYTGQMRIENVSDGYGFFGFSTRLASDPTDWDAIAEYRFGAVGESDYTITDELGTYELTKTDYQAFRAHAGEWKFTVNTTAMTLQMEPVSLDPVQTPSVYILGDVDGQGWFPNVGKLMEFDGEKYTAKINVDNAFEGWGYLGFTTMLADDSEDWDAIAGFRFGAESGEEENFVVIEEMLDNPLALSKTNYRAFQIAAGDYDVTIDADRTTVTFSKSTPEPITAFYILGNIDNQGWQPNLGLQMMTNDGITFTAEDVNFTPEYESEYSYFAFTSKLAETADDWDSIRSARYCADGTEDVLIDESNMYTNVSIVPYSMGQKSFKITPGYYNVTVNTELLWVNVSPGAGVEAVESDINVVSTKYVNALGQQSDRPFNGINIVVSRMSDGSIRASKMNIK